MIITKGRNDFISLDYCELKQNTLEDSLKLYNFLLLNLEFINPIGLELILTTNQFTPESSIIVNSIYSDITSDDIKEYLLCFFN